MLIIHPPTPPYFILTSLALRTQSCLRTLRWFKSITLGDRKTLLRCSDWGLLKFISCGIRPEIKKKSCTNEGRRVYMDVDVYTCVWISVYEERGKASRESHSDKCLVIPWVFYIFKLTPYLFPPDVFFFPFCLSILLVYFHTLFIVHISAYFSSHLHAHITHCEVFSVGSYLLFIASDKKEYSPLFFFSWVLEIITHRDMHLHIHT